MRSPLLSEREEKSGVRQIDEASKKWGEITSWEGRKKLVETG